MGREVGGGGGGGGEGGNFTQSILSKKGRSENPLALQYAIYHSKTLF